MATDAANLAIPYAWQMEHWLRVGQQAADQKLPHALMLAGHRGIGKRHFALAFSYLMLCLSPINNVPCGRCKGCELNLASTHPDLYVLEPEDGSRVIKIDQVRRLTEFLAKTSQQGGKKVAIIQPGEGLNVNAANALLKSLEEPSGNSLLLVVSHEPSQVMATIRSRCQRIDFSLPSNAESLTWLAPLVVGQSPQYLLDCVGGAPLDALSLMDGDALEQRQVLSSGLLNLAYSRSSALDFAAQLQRGEPLVVVESVMQHVQRGLRAGALQVEEQALPTDEEQERQLERVLAAIPSAIAFRFWDKLVSVKRQLLSASNPNKQLLLEELLMDWQALTKQSRVIAQSRQQMMNGLL